MKTFLLFLFLASFRRLPGGGISLVAGQLYTNLEDLAAYQGLPLGRVAGPSQQKATCMARVPYDLDGPHSQHLHAETVDYFRGAPQGLVSGYNPHYFCSNVPKMATGLPFARGAEEGYSTPHSRFWLKEPTAWHWGERADDQQVIHTAQRFNEAKKMGFIFRVEVTGIQLDGGRFLKGWYHLKINLDIDHNGVKDAQAADYVIDKLMVTARGRMLIAGKYYKKNERGPPRRAWVGGIGEFVKDFPPCQAPYDHPKEPYVTQQFMPCGAVQYSESQYGNNFYYSRGMKTGESKHGPNQGQNLIPNNEIHLNFRLDNSFCNRYYDLDFIANGIVMKKDQEPGVFKGTFLTRPKDTFIVQRSISTRFVFISSHAEHGPSYYENADPVPRGVDSVDCSKVLKGVHVMSTVSKTPDSGQAPPADTCNLAGPGQNEAPKKNSHNISVTEGANLEETNGEASSTFGGSIKFIYTLPTDLTTKPPSKNFDGRRTWTYPDIFRGKLVMWTQWEDATEFTDRGKLGPGGLDPYVAIHTAVQRVLHEFDWETWRELGRDGFSFARVKMDKELEQFPDGNSPKKRILVPWEAPGEMTKHGVGSGCHWCVVDFNKAGVGWTDSEGVQYWPHPYYDATCVGVDVGSPAPPTRIPRQTYYSLEQLDLDRKKGKTTVESSSVVFKMPPILGRCYTGLYWNPGFGALDNAPPPCNEFFADYERKTVDPALKRVKSAADGSARPHWETKYGEGSLERKQREQFCAAVDQLNKKYPSCPYIPAQPFTPVYNATIREQKVKIEKRKAKEYEHTLAYNRGMMIAENPYSLYVYDSRILHGLVMTIIVMFITPISIFLVRYFKETFMDSRLFLHRIWYFVHVGTSFLIPLLFIVAMWRLVEARAILGVSLSKTGNIHRLLGWVAILIFLLLTFLGGFRCMNRCLRGLTIFLHFILGFAFYFISLGLIMVSVAIPGSPSSSSTHDFSVIGTTNNGEKDSDVWKYLITEPIFCILIGWIVFDLVMHIFMTACQCCNDRKMKLTKSRICFGAGIPVLLENYRFDSPGRFCRINALRLYIVVTLGVTIAICVLIRLNSPRGRGFGFMSCTHTDDNKHSILKTYNGTTCYRDTKDF